MSEIKKEIDLNGLPRWENGKNKGSINWSKSIGCKCSLKYDDIKTQIEIIDYDLKTRKLRIKYNDKFNYISTRELLKCRFGKILNKHTSDFKIEIGTEFKDEKREIVIIDREYRKDKNGKRYKWYKYKCNKCEWDNGWTQESSLLKDVGCACCCDSPQIVVPGINDIPTTAPWMVKYFQGGIEEAKLYTNSSGKKIYPICPDCGKIKDKCISISTIHRNEGIGCICGDGISYPEKFMYYLLSVLNLDFSFQLSKKDFYWCKDKIYDFYIKNCEVIIETHGRQHYEECKNFNIKLKDQKNIDEYKKILAINNGVKKYIIIDCKYSDKDYIKISILNSELSKMFDLSNINWDKADEFATNNLVKEICGYYETHTDILYKELADKFKLNKTTISRYLKKGEKFGWCSNVKQRGKDSMSKVSVKTHSRKVFCIELNEEFESINTCKEQLSKRYNKHFNHSCISDVCRGRRNHHRGFTFKYV